MNAITAVTTEDALRKAIATAQAEYALHGYQLHPLDDGRFLAMRWGLVRELRTLAEAVQWLAGKVGA